MPSLYITEFATTGVLSTEGGGLSTTAGYRLNSDVARIPSVASQKITISGISTMSAAFNANTRLIRINTDTNCHIFSGTNPTATTDNLRMVADSTEYFSVTPGMKIAVIQGA